MIKAGPLQSVVIGLSAVVAGVRGGELAILTVHPRAPDAGAGSGAHPGSRPLPGLPFGPFDPQGDRTFELALRAFVTEQTRFELGYVEQLYTFGDKGRDAPLADLGPGLGEGDAGSGARVISVGYLALTPPASAAAPVSVAVEPEGDAVWSPWMRFFPWEDWRGGRPASIDSVIAPALRAWAAEAAPGVREQRFTRARLLFALDGARWNEERVLDRYELLYEAGLAPEAARDHARATGIAENAPALLAHAPFALGQAMASDHRRILATGLGRLRGKLKYRPVVFELAPQAFTLLELQRTVEAIAGVKLHKQNFRRVVERSGLVEGLGRMHAETGGRPAELFRYRREVVEAMPAFGLSLPGVPEG